MVVIISKKKITFKYFKIIEISNNPSRISKGFEKKRIMFGDWNVMH